MLDTVTMVYYRFLNICIIHLGYIYYYIHMDKFDYYCLLFIFIILLSLFYFYHAKINNNN